MIAAERERLASVQVGPARKRLSRWLPLVICCALILVTDRYPPIGLAPKHFSINAPDICMIVASMFGTRGSAGRAPTTDL